MRSYAETLTLLVTLLGKEPKDAEAHLKKLGDDALAAQYRVCVSHEVERKEVLKEWRRLQARAAEKGEGSDERCLQVCRAFIEHMGKQQIEKRDAVVPGYGEVGPAAGLGLLEDDSQGDSGERPVARRGAKARAPKK